MMRSCVRCVLVSLLVVLVSQSTVSGALVFDLEWESAEGGTGTAVGKLTVDETAMLNPTSAYQLHTVAPFVLDFEITVSGATSGNGTFGFSEFRDFGWDTWGATLDLTTELVGQPTPGNPWGTPDTISGDFNIFNLSPSAPSGDWYFTITTFSGSGEQLQLTSFRPAAVIPAPSALVLSLIGVVSLGAKRLRCKQ